MSEPFEGKKKFPEVIEAYEKMIFKNMTRLFVYKENEFVGLLSKSTVLRILSEPQS